MQDSFPVRTRSSRRSRPSLAAFADSGYEPSRPSRPISPLRNSTLPQSYTKNGTVTYAMDGLADPFDLGVASKLLSEDSLLKDPKASIRSRKVQTMRSFPFSIDGGEEPDTTSNGSGYGTGRFSNTFSKNGSSYNPKSTSISRSATISSAWSGVSNRLFMESVRDAGNQRQQNTFTEQFDKLAKKHGIQPFPHDYKAEPTSVSISSASRDHSSGDSTPSIPGNKFWNKLLRRTPSTIDVSKRHGNLKMSLTAKRNMSISDLAAIGKGKKDLLKGMHLEDIIRLGGVAIFNLPLGLAPGDLLIPTCMHAAATFILTHGLKTPGIFRVAGNTNTTFALYDHYQKQLEENNNEAVVATTALARLPTHIHYTIHEVAHLFKKLLHGLPGGLLGSPAVFQALYNIHSFVYPDPSLGGISKKVKPRMIALALASVNLHFRISLICAVFGLLRAINLASEQEAETKIKDPLETFTQMKDDSLGMVFGPLLLGDKSNYILTEELEDRGGLLVLPSIDPAANNVPKSGKKTKIDLAHSKKEHEKIRRAAMVCQMLIDNWEDICYQMRRTNTLSLTAQAYDLPAEVQPDFKYQQEEKTKGTIRERHDHKVTYGEGVTDRYGSAKYKRPEGKGNGPHQFLHGHRIPKLHMPHMTGHKFKKEVEDFMKFPAHSNPREEFEEEDLFRIPLVGERAEMSTIAEMTPVPSIHQQTPVKNTTPIHQMMSPQQQEPEDSPNWRIIDPEDMEDPETPIRRYDLTYRRANDDEMSISSSHVEGTRSSGTSSNAGSPVDVTPQPARRLRPSFEPSSPIEDDVVVDELMTLSAPPEMESLKTTRNASSTTFGRRAISPVPELSYTPKEISSNTEDIGRPITPKPLSYRKKGPSGFSIFEDEPGKTPKALSDLRPHSSPALTLTKPNAQSDIKINPKGTHSSPARNAPESPTQSQSVPLQPATPNRRPRVSVEGDFEDKYFFEAESPSPGKKVRGNTALYAEIRRLQRLVDQKTEEANSTRKELELAKNMASAGTLSHIVRETQEEMKVWKNRAEWAEKQLRTAAAVDIRAPNAVEQKGHSHRYSMG
ncbi:hypothetical protein EDC01DRAFT_116607 [Geopyxis carbonaria]|nr:hypothetical protein EDC01DRAFT_116607 [Geopyxis carbonaria]